MATKFTKAPWKAERSANDRRWQINANNLIIAEHTFDGDEAEANAKLIAAAPDLLEAITGEDVPQLHRNEWLGTLLRMFERGEYKYCGNQYDGNAEMIMLGEIGRMYELNKSAIKKATS